MNINSYLDKQVYADNYDGIKRDKVIVKVPKKGEEFMFFDRGICSLDRMYLARVMNVYTPEDAPDFVKEAFNKERHKTNVFYDHDENGNCVTDVYIECTISRYNGNNIWFVRTSDGGFYSIDIQSNWQSGRLDVDYRIMNYIDSLND